MKCTELMIRDWVAHPVNGELCKVVSLTSDIELDDGGFYEEVEPIPITAEILEKTFFSPLDMEGECFGFYDEYFEVEISKYTDGLWLVEVYEIEMSGLPSWRMFVSNLHELQHALRLCNIDWEIFPELKESEGERIRKWLEELIEAMPDNSIEFKELKRIDVLHWLEKQREQTHAKLGQSEVTKTSDQELSDKIEPKFKVGNWYQCTKDFFGKGVTFDKNIAYYCAKEGCLLCEYGCHIAIVKDLYDNFKLWTVQDAKDGDVLHSTGLHGDCIFIFNGLDNWRYDEPNGNRVVATGYCCITLSANNVEFGIQGPDCIEVDRVKPATKEQRDLLFTKMKEEGYEWDAEKKELKKMEVVSKEREGEKIRKWLIDWAKAVNYWSEQFTITKEQVIDWLEKQAVKKTTAWDEKDDNKVKEIIEYLKELFDNYRFELQELNDYETWLKSIKQRLGGEG